MTALVQADRVSRSFGGRGLLRRGRTLHAVQSVDMAIARGEAVGLVGESGSGKSTLGRLLLGLLPPTAGQVLVDGANLADASAAELRRLRRRMQLVFQDPHSSLDPRRRVGAQIADGLEIHRLLPASQRPARVATLLAQVGLPPGHADRYPHEFSGGQRQRVAIARALATAPDILVADEPVSALDVSVQAQVLALLSDLRSRLGLALLFISHDLPVVRTLCDRVLVMHLGRVVEQGPAAAVLRTPLHPYTQALLSAAPSLSPRPDRIILRGEPPSPYDPPSGCVFRTRCSYAVEACVQTVPTLASRGDAAHGAACIRNDLQLSGGVRR